MLDIISQPDTPMIPDSFDSFDESVASLLNEIDYRNNPYFVALKDGSFEKEDFIETQIAFSHQVASFNRAMLMAASRITLPERRWPAVANVLDEHHGGDIPRAHYHTIREFVRRVSGDPDIDIDGRSAWPEVQQNIATMFGIASKGFNLGLAGLAMIERMFADISDWIAHATINNGWIRRDDMIHYKLHAQIDMRHAEELFDVLREDWQRSQDWRYYVYQGLWVGGWSFDSMWRGLWNARKRRLLRNSRAPHLPW